MRDVGSSAVIHEVIWLVVAVICPQVHGDKEVDGNARRSPTRRSTLLLAPGVASMASGLGPGPACGWSHGFRHDVGKWRNIGQRPSV